MKMFSFIVSVVAFVVSLSFIIFDFPDVSSINGIIYFSMLLILVLICITGIIINIPLFTKGHKKFSKKKGYNMHT